MAAHPASLTRRLRLVVVTLGLAWGAAVPHTAQPDPPRRVITVIPAVTEILFAIGAGDRLVGIGSFDQVPTGHPDIERVGGLIDPDLERILSLRPDLVVLYASQVEAREQLARADIPVMVYRHEGLGDIASTIRTLGTRLGDPGDAERVASRLERGVDAVRRRVAGRRRPRTLLVFSREPGSLRNVYASGGVGFLHDMLDAAGGENVFADVRGERVAQVGAESLLNAAPEVIIEIRNDGALTPAALARERAVWQRLGAVPAVSSDRVHFLVGGEFVVPGPRVLDAVEQLARLLHPDAF